MTACRSQNRAYRRPLRADFPRLFDTFAYPLEMAC